MPTELAVLKDDILRYNATCSECGESFMLTNWSEEVVESTKNYDCTVCGAEKSVFVHKLTTILIENGRGVLK